VSESPTKQPHGNGGWTYNLTGVDVFAEEGNIRYHLGHFDHAFDSAAILALHSIQFIGAGNDELALSLLQNAVAKLKARMQLFEMPVNSKYVM
jgi:hypothetical protein